MAPGQGGPRTARERFNLGTNRNESKA